MYNKVFTIKNITFSIDDVLSIAREAGEAILKIYTNSYKIGYKQDSSPLTEADTLSHHIITTGLNNLVIKYSKGSTLSSFPVLSEEGKNISFQERKHWKLFWMIDSLDGTKEFIKKKMESSLSTLP